MKEEFSKVRDTMISSVRDTMISADGGTTFISPGSGAIGPYDLFVK